jgi:hypothetical protein
MDPVLSSDSMTFKFFAISAAAVAAAAFAFVLIVSIEPNSELGDTDHHVDENSAVTIGEIDDSEGAGVASPSRISANTEIAEEELIMRFHSARSAYEALATINQLYSQGYRDAAEELEGVLAGACRPMPIRVELGSMKWISRELDQYCQEFAFDDEQFAEIVARTVHNMETTREAVRDRLYSVPRSQSDAVLWKFIDRASNWQDLEAIKSAIALSPLDLRSRNDVFDLGQDDNFIGDQGRKVQLNALTLLQCENFGGGCGAGSLRMLEQCYVSGLCEPYWNIHDYFANTLSPVELSQTYQVFSFLKRLIEPEDP